MNLDEYIEDMMAQLFLRARSQFGSAIKSFWFYDGDGCPGCGRKVDAIQIKGQNATSLNAFIYRERGVLIGYFLCSRCATEIFAAVKRRPGRETSRHATIETNLIKAYQEHLRSLAA